MINVQQELNDTNLLLIVSLVLDALCKVVVSLTLHNVRKDQLMAFVSCHPHEVSNTEASDIKRNTLRFQLLPSGDFRSFLGSSEKLVIIFIIATVREVC